MAKKDNHAIRNIYYMLSYAFQTLRETGYRHLCAEEFDNIHDLFATIIIRGTSTQVKRGLHRDYIQTEEIMAGVRGQISVAQTIKQQSQPQGRLVCVHDEFTSNSPHNQALKSVMLLLLRHGNVRPENKKNIRKLLLYFSEVSDVLPSAIRWDALKYHRNNAAYRMLLGVCYLTVKGLLMKEGTGAHRLLEWLQDEEMYRLYERFVLSYYRYHHPDYLPHAALINWDIAENVSDTFLPVMKTDIMLMLGEKRLIIDTKYYAKTMQYNAHLDRKTFISGHLYQIYAYVKNYDKHSSGKTAGVLLYAKTDEVYTPNEDFLIGGSRISLKTLDLNQNWSVITQQLEDLCTWLKAA